MGRKRVKMPDKTDVVPPNEMQMARAQFDQSDIVDKRPGGGQVIIGKAFRRKPMVEILAGQGLFSAAEFKALTHYRHHADMADRSPIRDSLCLHRFGGTGHPTVSLLNAIRIRDDCERAAGSLAPMLRAVIVDDASLSEWAIHRSGSVEVCRDRRGKLVCTIEPRRSALEMAKLEMQILAKRVEQELAA